MIKIRKLILSLIFIVVGSFTILTVSANNETTHQNGIATISGKTNATDKIEISLPSGQIIETMPDSSGNYSTKIKGLSVGDTIYVTAVSTTGQKSKPTKHTITTADVLEEDDTQSRTASAVSSHSVSPKRTDQSQVKKHKKSFPWIQVLLWLGGVVGVTVGGAAVVNSRLPKVQHSIFSLVGSGLLWRSQQTRHSVKLIGKINAGSEKAFFDVTTNELKILAATGEVELNRKFTTFEVKVFNRQNDDVKMVLVDE